MPTATTKRAAAKRTTTGRVTAKAPAKPKLPKNTALATLDDGTEFLVNTKVNQFRLMRVQASIAEEKLDVAGFYRLIVGLVYQPDEDRFVKYMEDKGDDANTPDDYINTVIGKLMEAAGGGNPTDSQSDSGLTARRITSTRRSAAG